MLDDEAMTRMQMTSLKKHLSRLPQVARRLWSSYSSTTYGLSMVTQGHLAVAFDQLTAAMASPSISPQAKLKMEHCYTNLSAALEESQLLSELLGEIECFYEDAAH